MVMITVSTCKCDPRNLCSLCTTVVAPISLLSCLYDYWDLSGTCNGVTWDVIRTFSNGKCGALIMESNVIM